jgi:hypothetical protein
VLGIVVGTCLASCGGEIADIGIIDGRSAPSDPPPLAPTPTSTPGEHDSSRAVASNDAGTECAAFVTSAPADKKTKVGVFDDVTLDYCGALDPATVTNLHVELLAPHATVGRKAVVVSYDAPNRRILLHPSLPMDADATYRVRATGLKTARGTPIAGVAFSFHTVRSPMARSYGPIGGAQEGQVSTFDAEGRLSRVLVFAPGPDGVAGTADDVDTRYGYTFVYSSTGHTEVTSSAGPDGIFDTSDDVVYDIVGREDSEVAPYTAWTARTRGPDGQLGTEDDGYINCGREYFTDDGRPGNVVWFKNAGADGIPFTDDDPIMSYSTVEEMTPGHRRVLWYHEPGPDGKWRTPDDTPDAMLLNTVDEVGRSLLEVHREPGPDGIWQPADGSIYEIHQYSYDSRGLETSYRTFTNPGRDQIWLTPDDLPWNVGTYSYDPAGNVTALDSGGIHSAFAPQL